jgi:hypothetical protein
MNRFSSHPNHENRPLYEGPPPQDLSEARQEGSFFLIVPDPLHRKSRRGRGRRLNTKAPKSITKIF